MTKIWDGCGSCSSGSDLLAIAEPQPSLLMPVAVARDVFGSLRLAERALTGD